MKKKPLHISTLLKSLLVVHHYYRRTTFLFNFFLGTTFFQIKQRAQRPLYSVSRPASTSVSRIFKNIIIIQKAYRSVPVNGIILEFFVFTQKICQFHEIKKIVVLFGISSSRGIWRKNLFCFEFKLS